MAQQSTTPGSILQNARVEAILSTTDLNRSRSFYEGKLGLNVADTDSEGVRYEVGNTHLYVYHRPEPPKAENTVAGFFVPNVEEAVQAMQAAGVTFEEYDMPNLKTINGVATSPDGSWKSAWFKDPDGNIIAVGQWK